MKRLSYIEDARCLKVSTITNVWFKKLRILLKIIFLEGGVSSNKCAFCFANVNVRKRTNKQFFFHFVLSV